MRRDCALSTLTDEQQADLFDWLSTGTYEHVQTRIAQSPPEGFGIKTHITTLARFFQERNAQIRARDLATALAAAVAAEDSRPKTQDAFIRAAKAAHAHTTFLYSNSPSNPVAYRAVSRVLNQHEENGIKRDHVEIARQQIAIARERLEFSRLQFEYNAARAAMSALADLVQIEQTPGIDDEEKIWRVRTRLFGGIPPKSAAPGSGSDLPLLPENLRQSAVISSP